MRIITTVSFIALTLTTGCTDNPSRQDLADKLDDLQSQLDELQNEEPTPVEEPVEAQCTFPVHTAQDTIEESDTRLELVSASHDVDIGFGDGEIHMLKMTLKVPDCAGQGVLITNTRISLGSGYEELVDSYYSWGSAFDFDGFYLTSGDGIGFVSHDEHGDPVTQIAEVYEWVDNPFGWAQKSFRASPLFYVGPGQEVVIRATLHPEAWGVEGMSEEPHMSFQFSEIEWMPADSRHFHGDGIHGLGLPASSWMLNDL